MQREPYFYSLGDVVIGVDLNEDTAAPFLYVIGGSFEVGVASDVTEAADVEAVEEVGVCGGEMVFIDEEGRGEGEVGVECAVAVFAGGCQGSSEVEVKAGVEAGGGVGEGEGGGVTVVTGGEGEHCWFWVVVSGDMGVEVGRTYLNGHSLQFHRCIQPASRPLPRVPCLCLGFQSLHSPSPLISRSGPSHQDPSTQTPPPSAKLHRMQYPHNPHPVVYPAASSTPSSLISISPFAYLAPFLKTL